MRINNSAKVTDLWLALEGVDGIGKSTTARAIQELWHPDTTIVEEPHGTRLGEDIFDITTYQVNARSRALAFASLINETYDTIIKLRLHKNIPCISVRSYPSTIIYQGVNPGAERFIEEMYDLIFERMTWLPRVFVLHAQKEVLADRHLNRPDENTCADQIPRLLRMQGKYVARAKKHSWELIDTTDQSPMETAESVLNLLTS